MTTLESEWDEFRATAMVAGLNETQVKLVRNVFMSGAAAALTVVHEQGLTAAILEVFRYSLAQGQVQAEPPATGSPTPGPSL